jgi:hypothetical protein
MGLGARIAALVVVGLGVAFFVWASSRSDWEPISITAVAAASDSADISVTLSHSQCRRGPRVRVVGESDDAVRLRGEQDEGGGCDDIGLTSETSVALDSELGARRIEIEERRTPEGNPPISCVVDGQVSDRCVANVRP